MDPNVTLQWINDFLGNNDIESAENSVEDLADWIEKGGFLPDWDRYPKATFYFFSLIGCQKD